VKTTLSIEHDGITAVLSFALNRAVESPLFADLTTPGTPGTQEHAPDQVAMRMATAAAPLLLLAFEQAQTIDEHSQAVLSSLQTPIVKE
jgi:hypothetical protein